MSKLSTLEDPEIPVHLLAAGQRYDLHNVANRDRPVRSGRNGMSFMHYVTNRR